MGYDIYSYIPKQAPEDPMSRALREEMRHQIAFIEMGARSPAAPPLCQALNADEYDGTVSGTGIGRYFSNDELQQALKRLCAAYVEGKASAATLRFLAETVDRAYDEPWVYIDFG